MIDTSTTTSDCCMAGGAYLLENLVDCTELDCSSKPFYLFEYFTVNHSNDKVRRQITHRHLYICKLSVATQL